MFRVRRPPLRRPNPVRIAVRVQTEPLAPVRHWRWALPSWLLSFVIHAGILCGVWLSLHSWRSGAGGLGENLSSELRLLSGDGSSSLYSIQMSPAVEAPGDVNEAAAAENLAEAPPDHPSDDVITSTAVLPLTAELSLPSVFESQGLPATPPVAATAASGGGVASAREFVQGSAGATGGPPGGGGIGGTSFLGISDKATRVVYVIDSSASMYNHQAMQAAKAALLASLQALDDSQQFQVIFYNDRPTLLRFRGNRDPTLAFATEVNKSLARQEISAVVPDLGTNHFDALKLALRLNPEVIYLLTDADEPQLTASELEQIHRLNQQRARIHCIEFGKGAALDAGALNFLQKLSRQNNGGYRYQDVKRFGAQALN